MRADWSVEAVVVNDDAVDWLTGDEVLTDDLRHVVNGDAAVPDGFRIDHYGRAMLALVEASGFVYADRGGKACRPHGILEGGVKLTFAVGSAGGPGAPRLTEVGTDEDVAFEFRQSRLLADGDFQFDFT